ncbi:MAG: hypothetical protein M4579_006137 [Chaenotheca gracillima]|nr:MAG: hypothetical protein M4579_006137 [Chaenotheca gracillima]
MPPSLEGRKWAQMNSPRPKERFDPEACRDYLVLELGLKIGTVYEYAAGIEEIRTRVFLKYGGENYPRVMAMLYDLIESEDNAWGVGDEGDAFSSWRHDHKKRAIDLSNPGAHRFPQPIVRDEPRRRAIPLNKPRTPLTAPIPSSSKSFRIVSKGDDRERQVPRSQSEPIPSPVSDVHFELTPHTVASCDDLRVAAVHDLTVGPFLQKKPLHERSAEYKRDKQTPKVPVKTLRKSVSQGFARVFDRKSDIGPPVPPKDNTYSVGNWQTRTHAAPRPRRISSPKFMRTTSEIPAVPIIDAQMLKKAQLSTPIKQQDLPPPSRARNKLDGGSGKIRSSRSYTQLPATVNKRDVLPPLPLNTPKTGSSRAMGQVDNSSKMRTNLPHASPSRDTTSSKNTASMSSAGVSTPSSKHGSRGITRGMLKDSSPDQSGMFGNFTPLEPPKFSPQESIESPLDVSREYHSFASTTKTNQFVDERNTVWPSIEETSKYGNKPSYHTNVPKSMSQSRSENNLAARPRRAPSPIDTSQGYRGRTTAALHAALPARGRSTSPVKFLKQLKEVDERGSEPPRSPTKRSRSPIKTLFGEGGWLSKSNSLKEMPEDPFRKSGFKNWSSKVKQRVEGMTEGVIKLIPSSFSHESTSKSPQKSKFPVSLDPPTQCQVYSEVELMICVTANAFLMQQHNAGRMTVESVHKIVDFWRGKGRPQVIEFQFDQATQRDLVLYNVKNFRFYGNNAQNIMALNSMLYGWKALAKEMSVRTFCTPDSVIKKHLHDIQKVLEMLGAPMTTFLAFQEVQAKALRLMREEQQRRLERKKIQPGVERVWNPPSEVPTHARRSGQTERSGSVGDMFQDESAPKF